MRTYSGTYLSALSLPVTATGILPVYICGASGFFREYLQYLLTSDSGAPVHTTPDHSAAVAVFPTGPFVLVWDIDRETHLVEKITEVKEKFPQARILLLGTFSHPDFVRELLHTGAQAYVHKDCDYHTFIREMQWLSSAEYEPGQKKQEIALPGFTNREMEMMKWITRGLTEQEMADLLFISILTVKSHKKNLFLKTGSRNVVSLVRYILENGFDRL